jgi:hypothetical protein
MNSKLLKYKSIIKDILRQHTKYRNKFPDPYQFQVIFDDDRGHYLFLDLGWNESKYFHVTPIHIDLIGDKIWIQYDGT